MELKAIRNEYSKREHQYEQLKDEVLNILEKELKRHHIRLHLLEGRVKKIDSFIAKAKRISIDYPFDEIDDICGTRVICLFRSDIESIEKIICENFKIIYIDNKITTKPIQEFGYFSTHCVGMLPKQISGQRYDKIKNLRFEIQIRTIAMHAWATISHYIDYKSHYSTPAHLRKDFIALSALFHVADTNFELFFQSSKEARKQMEQRFSKVFENKEPFDIEINIDSLSVYLKKLYPDRKHCEEGDLSLLIDELIASGYRTILDLDVDLRRSEEALKKFEEQTPSSNSDVGMIRSSLSIANENFAGKRYDYHGRYARYRLYLK